MVHSILRLLLVAAAALLVKACGTQVDPPGDASSSERNASQSVPQWLIDITDEAGLDFSHETGATGRLFMPEIMGAGAALFDADNDGDLDIYLTNGNRALPGFQPEPSSDLVNRLYLQQPDGRFHDATDSSGLGDAGYGMGVAIGDIDNDGDADVYVTNYGPDQLYRNRGDGTFKNITTAAGIDVPQWSASAGMFDYDRDGWLDIYVTRYVDYDADRVCSDAAGRPDYCSPSAFHAVPDVLLHNNGDGTFTDVSVASGIATVSYAGLGVTFADFNHDDWIDIYVANDGHPNQLWINQRDGTFRDRAVVMGAAYNRNGEAEAGMGVVAADFDQDDDDDIFLTHLADETNTLFLNLADEDAFLDRTAAAGLGASSVEFTGFGTAAVDLECDGDLDLLVVNGRVTFGTARTESGLPAPWSRFAEPKLVYLNDGRARFSLLDDSVASFRRSTEISRGLAMGDIDRDGDADFLISNIQGRARLIRNDTPRSGHWLSVRAFDPALHRDALGARVTVVDGERRRRATVSAASSYLSSNEPRVFFGLGSDADFDHLEVRWPDGAVETFPPAFDRAIELRRGEGTNVP